MDNQLSVLTFATQDFSTRVDRCVYDLKTSLNSIYKQIMNEDSNIIQVHTHKIVIILICMSPHVVDSKLPHLSKIVQNI